MFQFWAPVPVKAQTEAPILLKTEKPRYCWAGPIVLTLKVPRSVFSICESPSWKVSLPLPSTLPLMLKPGASVSVNGPVPGLTVKSIALAPLAVMVPEL
jgi:hypothetical protein